MASAPVDIPVQVKGLSDIEKLTRRMQALEKEVTRLQTATPKAANGVRGFGRSAKGAAGGVKALGASVKAALGPIAPFLAAIAGVGAAFNAIKNQDFAEAKFESLGGNADQLVTNLQAVSNELQGTASVAELTGAAYDVASAGFSSAAEASLVLKAASLGATGGFSDLNTVANATTSVLNAYGLSAAEAGKVVDQFITTQNQGKIVVAEYAQNIGKVASAAAGLGVPLSEVNAVIAQATASGVQADVAFTGLKGALARLASGEAAKALKGTGIEIDAASVKADGLFGTLKKLEGLDTGQIFKALGTEAGPALLPVIQNLEKYEELLKGQEQANGVAAAAAATASGTIEGAWKRVTVAFENLFADQSELGQLIRGTLLVAAATVEALAAAFKILVTPIRAAIEYIGQIVSAFTGLEDGEQVLQSLTALWFQQLQRIQEVTDTIIAVGRVLGQYVGGVITEIRGWFSGLWNSISGGVQNVVGAITGAFSAAFQGAKRIILGFWNSLPSWLRGALETAGSVAGGVIGAVQSAIGKVVDDINAAKAQVQIEVPGSGQQQAVTAPTRFSGGGAGGGGGGGGGGGTQAADKLAQQMEAGKALAKQFERQIALRNEEDEVERKLLQNKFDLEDAIKQINERAAEGQRASLIALATENSLAEATKIRADADAKAEERIRSALEPLQEQRQYYQDIIAFGTEEAEIRKEIRDAMEGLPEDQREIVEQLIRGNVELEKQMELTQEIDQLYADITNSVAGGLINGINGLIDGSKSLQESLAGILKDIGKILVKFAVMQAFKSFGLPGFAEGGRPTVGDYAVVGERGPELVKFDKPATVYSNDQSKSMVEAMGRYGPGNSGGGGGAAAEMGDEGKGGVALADAPINISTGPVMQFNSENYVTQAEFAKGVQSAAKQGEQRALRKLANSPGQRRRIGL